MSGPYSLSCVTAEPVTQTTMITYKTRLTEYSITSNHPCNPSRAAALAVEAWRRVVRLGSAAGVGVNKLSGCYVHSCGDIFTYRTHVPVIHVPSLPLSPRDTNTQKCHAWKYIRLCKL